MTIHFNIFVLALLFSISYEDTFFSLSLSLYLLCRSHFVYLNFFSKSAKKTNFKKNHYHPTTTTTHNHNRHHFFLFKNIRILFIINICSIFVVAYISFSFYFLWKLLWPQWKSNLTNFYHLNKKYRKKNNSCVRYAWTTIIIVRFFFSLFFFSSFLLSSFISLYFVFCFHFHLFFSVFRRIFSFGFFFLFFSMCSEQMQKSIPLPPRSGHFKSVLKVVLLG